MYRITITVRSDELAEIVTTVLNQFGGPVEIDGVDGFGDIDAPRRLPTIADEPVEARPPDIGDISVLMPELPTEWAPHELTRDDQLAYNQDVIDTVPCPKCGANVGESCRPRDGEPYGRTFVHNVRYQAYNS